ncbi:F-box domain-containing protein [Amniculicola lignicola CBS 123094]|uniref:F-box domain-containing protein n=1 Tax=Amniculicola lignicola CBS 123094 TaxID=1392246 RepID=A0A6A5W9R7_9PLEO|nr:F-box domain-containing protein [Amniculicola lignicola CBS 123094]
MGFMKRFRGKKSPKNKDSQLRDDAHAHAPNAFAYRGPDCTQRLDDKLLRRIFEFVCPHSTDESFDASEDSGNDEGCMSCDMRDMGHAALVKRQWYGIAAGLLYKSIRIDAVHYCELEEVYAEARRRKSRGGDEIDAPTTRLQQLCRTVRDNHYIAARVRFLKLPYMTRESCKTDIARLVSVCSNLEYVDLPDGFYTGDASCHTLRQEVQARCPHMRKMKYNEGSEHALETLLHGYWQELRVLEISRVRLEPGLLRRVFGILPFINDVLFSELPWMNDSIFSSAPGIPDFPPLETLRLKKMHGVTAEGIAQYLTKPVCRDTLAKIQIKDCSSLPVFTLHIILTQASRLKTLEYHAVVSSSLPIDPLPPLTSTSLRVLNFEIIPNATKQMYPPSESYYQYLTTSLMSNCLPRLRVLYVRDPTFPESLALAPPIRPFADMQSLPRGFSQPLEIFSKGLDELEWIFTSIIPPDAYGRRGSLSGGRPLSSYSANKGLGPQWGGDARKSVVVPNGFGGFLAVPADEERPRSAGNLTAGGGGNGVRASWMSQGGNRRGSRADLWR